MVADGRLAAIRIQFPVAISAVNNLERIWRSIAQQGVTVRYAATARRERPTADATRGSLILLTWSRI